MPYQTSVVLDSLNVTDTLVVDDTFVNNEYSVTASNINFAGDGLIKLGNANSLACFPVFQAHRKCTITKITFKIDTVAAAASPLWLIFKMPTGTAFPAAPGTTAPFANLAAITGAVNMVSGAEGVLGNVDESQLIIVPDGTETITSATVGVGRSVWSATPYLATTSMLQGDSIWVTATGTVGTAFSAGIVDVTVFWKDAVPTATTVVSTDRLHYSESNLTTAKREVSSADSLSCDYLSIKNPRGLSVAGAAIRPQRIYMTTANCKDAATFLSNTFINNVTSVADGYFPLGVCPFDCRIISLVGRAAAVEITQGTITLHACLPSNVTRTTTSAHKAIQTGAAVAFTKTLVSAEGVLIQFPAAGTNCVFDGELPSDADNGNTIGTLGFIPAGSLILIQMSATTNGVSTFFSVELEAYQCV